MAYCCTLARELARQSEIPMLEKGLDHQFCGLAHFRRFYLCDEPAACRLASAEVGKKVCCSLVTDHEGITLIALRAHSSYRIQKGLLVKYMGAFSMMGNVRGGGTHNRKGRGCSYSLLRVSAIFLAINVTFRVARKGKKCLSHAQIVLP